MGTHTPVALGVSHLLSPFFHTFTHPHNSPVRWTSFPQIHSTDEDPGRREIVTPDRGLPARRGPERDSNPSSKAQGPVLDPPNSHPALATLQNSREHAKVLGTHTTERGCLPPFGRRHSEWVEPVASQNLGEQ